MAKPAPWKRSRRSGSCRAWLTAWFRRASTGLGTPAGATRPNHGATATGTPSSVTDGTSGSSGERRAPVTARALSLPALTRLATAVMFSGATETSPDSSPCMAGPSPL